MEITKEQYEDAINFLIKNNYNITLAVNEFMRKYPSLSTKSNKMSLAARLLWYRRTKKVIISPRPKIDHNRLIMDVKNELIKRGYRVIVIGNKFGRIPDLILVEGERIRIKQVEVEVGPYEREVSYKRDPQFDDFIVIHSLDDLKNLKGGE
jgi:hypothetical protein